MKRVNNKWFLAFVIAAAVALVCLIVAIVLAVNSGKRTNGGGDDDVDVYYYDTAEGDMVLSLMGYGEFSLSTFNVTKTGTYTIEGEVVTLDFIKDSDGTATGSFSGEKLVLDYNGAKLPFIPMVSYTVTFGGTEMAPTSVINGKTLAKPADPVKEDHVFFGWYADPAYTTPYDFDATLVKSDITIYAKWVPAELFG